MTILQIGEPEAEETVIDILNFSLRTFRYELFVTSFSRQKYKIQTNYDHFDVIFPTNKYPIDVTFKQNPLSTVFQKLYLLQDNVVSLHPQNQSIQSKTIKAET